MRPLHLKKVPYVEQMRQTECGLCCVAMILQYYNSHEGIRTIRKELENYIYEKENMVHIRRGYAQIRRTRKDKDKTVFIRRGGAALCCLWVKKGYD